MAIRYAGADLYPKQRDAIFDPRRISICEASTKAGKTVACLAWLFEQSMGRGAEGRSFWWVAPVYGQAEIAYRRMKQKLPDEIFTPNEQKLRLTLMNGALLEFKSGERPDGLYGDDVYAAVLDEASRMREAAWHAVRSTLTKTKGPVRIIGNVRGRKNWFYKMARLAEGGGETDMGYHKITAYDAISAGVLDAEEIESARRHFEKLGQEQMFRELYLAEASEDGANPFGLQKIKECLVDSYSTEYPLVAGVDLAGRGAVNLNATGDPLSRDWTAIVMLDRNGHATLTERFRKPHTETTQEIVKLVGRTPALIDSTGAGDPIVETLQRRGDMRVEGYTYTERSRQDLLENLALAIGEGAIKFPDGPLRAELESFEFRYTARGVRYAVPDGMHDDLAMALALAVRKLPWKRLYSAAPMGIAQVGGSRWDGETGSDAYRKYLDSQRPGATSSLQGDPTQLPEGIAVPTLIVGGRWGDAGRR